MKVRRLYPTPPPPIEIELTGEEADTLKQLLHELLNDAPNYGGRRAVTFVRELYGLLK